MEQIFIPAAQLGGTVFTVVAFLWYLNKKDDSLASTLERNADFQLRLTKSLERLIVTVEKNSITIAPAVAENTDAVKKNTKVINEAVNGGKE